MAAIENSSQTYKFGITMPCGGCSGAITRVLGKLEGVESFDVSLDAQTATVITKDDTLSYDTVLSVIHKTGKKILSGEANGKTMGIEPASEDTETK